MMTRCLVSWARGEAWVETTRTTRADACEKKHLFRGKKSKAFSLGVSRESEFSGANQRLWLPGWISRVKRFFHAVRDRWTR
jgi:hypothetical protein